ncbi:hypothetical protein PHJA_002864500, partial [Phtheirospermum japonicum]
RYSGVLGIEKLYQSIPNLVVKLYCGDDTVGEVLRNFINSKATMKDNSEFALSTKFSFADRYR